MLQRKATVLAIIKETHDTISLRLSIQPPITFIPGQFITLLYPLEGVIHRRPYSIANAPVTKDYVEIGIKIYPQGKISPLLGAMTVGDIINVIGPFGRFTFEEHEKFPVFIGAGSGIVPLMSMLRHCICAMDDAGEYQPTLLYSNKNPEDIIYHDELLALASKYHHFTYVPTVTRSSSSSSWTGQTGRIDKEMLLTHVPAIDKGFYYLCGPPEFVGSIVALLNSLGVAKERIKREEYQ